MDSKLSITTFGISRDFSNFLEFCPKFVIQNLDSKSQNLKTFWIDPNSEKWDWDWNIMGLESQYDAKAEIDEIGFFYKFPSNSENYYII